MDQELGHWNWMASWFSRTAEFWNKWGLRIAVLSSLASHVALVLLAGTRRRNLSLWGWLLLWPAYQIADISATYALGKLSLGGTGTCAGAGASSSTGSSCEQQLVAFWAPFLLLHLGRPDNISTYALEDNTLSLRQALQVALQVAGTSYVLYHYIYLGGHGGASLLAASALMFAAGVAKYVERAVALWRGNLEHMRSSSKKKKKKRHQQQEQSTPPPTLPGLKQEEEEEEEYAGRRPELDHEQALRFCS